jgi:hypothetical protein
MSFCLSAAQFVGQSLLNKVLPWLVPPPALTEISKSIPYAQIQARMRRDKAVFNAILAAFVSVVVGWVMRAAALSLRAV